MGSRSAWEATTHPYTPKGLPRDFPGPNWQGKPTINRKLGSRNAWDATTYPDTPKGLPKDFPGLNWQGKPTINRKLGSMSAREAASDADLCPPSIGILFSRAQNAFLKRV